VSRETRADEDERRDPFRPVKGGGERDVSAPRGADERCSLDAGRVEHRDQVVDDRVRLGGGRRAAEPALVVAENAVAVCDERDDGIPDARVDDSLVQQHETRA
jgi:hypothetical protein